MEWNFPEEKKILMRIEVAIISVIAGFIFLYGFFNLQVWWHALLMSVLFVIIYIVVSLVTQEVQQLEEKYVVKGSNLEITRKTRRKTKKVKVSLKGLKKHKVDKRFLGAYIVNKKGKRHPLFFNSKKEINKFEKIIKRHLA